MDLLPITKDKLKIMLTKEDLARFGLSCETLDYHSTETRCALWRLFDEVKQKTGFDAAKGKLFVQVYTAKDGGCEMYITQTKQNAAEGVSFQKETCLIEKTLFSFATLDDMLAACLSLCECGIHTDSVAYAEMHTYYLALGSDIGNHLPSRYPSHNELSAGDLMAEFGKKEEPAKEAWLSEHGSCICPDHAVERYAALAATGYHR